MRFGISKTMGTSTPSTGYSAGTKESLTMALARSSSKTIKDQMLLSLVADAAPGVGRVGIGGIEGGTNELANELLSLALDMIADEESWIFTMSSEF